MKALSDRILNPLIELAHDRLGLSPNQVSTCGFVVGLLAAMCVALGHIDLGMLLLALAQIVDGVDGGIARRYNLGSPRGAILELRMEDYQRGIKILEKVEALRSLVLSGDKIHVVVDDLGKGEKLIREVLREQGLGIHGLEEVRPSLEDAFVSMVQDKRKH